MNRLNFVKTFTCFCLFVTSAQAQDFLSSYSFFLKINKKFQDSEILQYKIKVSSAKIDELAGYLKSRGHRFVKNKKSLELSLKDYVSPSPKGENTQDSGPSEMINIDSRYFNYLKQVLAKNKSRLTPQIIGQISFDYIQNKIGYRGLDPASFVAKNRAGDHSEHSFLLTALLRMNGYKAKPVFGTVISKRAKRWRAYNRSWVLYRTPNSRKWLRIDPLTVYKTSLPAPVAYIPSFELPSESLDVYEKIDGVKLQHISGIELL